MEKRGKKVVDFDDIQEAFDDVPELAIARLRGAIEDPALRGADFSEASAYVMISEIQERDGQLEEAAETLREAIDRGVKGSYVDPRPFLASLLVKLDRKDEAAELYKRHRKEFPLIYNTYGEALEGAYDLEDAAKVFAAGEFAAIRAGDSDDAKMHAGGLHRVRREMGFDD